MITFSFVIPCYRSENTITIVVNEIKQLMNDKDEEYEIVLVDDHSPDSVWDVITRLCDENYNIKGISFAKNFGQHAALLAGYNVCSGEYIVSLDDDGQTPLESLFDMYEKLGEGYDVVYAYYEEIKQNVFRKLGTKMANKLGEKMLNIPKGFKGSSFYIARKFVIDEIIKYQNAYPYLAGLVFRTTQNVTNVKTKHRSRISGKSGYSFRKLLSLWLNGFTAFSVKPLEISAYMGFSISVIGFIYTIVIIFQKILGLTQISGWSSILAALLIIGGFNMIMLGLIGEYIGRIYISINNSPQYVIKDNKNI